MSAEEIAELKMTIAMLRSSLASTRGIIEACRNIVERPETIDEEQRQSVIEVLNVTLANIDELLEKAAVDSSLEEGSDGPPSAA